MKDPIERQDAIEAVTGWLNIARNPINQSKYNEGEIAAYETALSELKKTPSAQPDEEKISDALYYIYRNTSPHTSAEGVAAIKYYIREIYREIFGEEGPGWMRR